MWETHRVTAGATDESIRSHVGKHRVTAGATDGRNGSFLVDNDPVYLGVFVGGDHRRFEAHPLHLPQMTPVRWRGRMRVWHVGRMESVRTTKTQI